MKNIFLTILVLSFLSVFSHSKADCKNTGEQIVVPDVITSDYKLTKNGTRLTFTERDRAIEVAPGKFVIDDPSSPANGPIRVMTCSGDCTSGDTCKVVDYEGLNCIGCGFRCGWRSETASKIRVVD